MDRYISGEISSKLLCNLSRNSSVLILIAFDREFSAGRLISSIVSKTGSKIYFFSILSLVL